MFMIQPNIEKMAFFIQTAKKFGYDIDTKSNEAISKTINHMVENRKVKWRQTYCTPLRLEVWRKLFIQQRTPITLV